MYLKTIVSELSLVGRYFCQSDSFYVFPRLCLLWLLYVKSVWPSFLEAFMIISIITISVTKQTPSTDYLAPSIIVSCRLATAVSNSPLLVKGLMMLSRCLCVEKLPTWLRQHSSCCSVLIDPDSINQFVWCYTARFILLYFLLFEKSLATSLLPKISRSSFCIIICFLQSPNIIFFSFINTTTINVHVTVKTAVYINPLVMSCYGLCWWQSIIYHCTLLVQSNYL